MTAPEKFNPAGAITRRAEQLRSTAAQVCFAWESLYVEMALCSGAEPEFGRLAASIRELRRLS